MEESRLAAANSGDDGWEQQSPRGRRGRGKRRGAKGAAGGGGARGYGVETPPLPHPPAERALGDTPRSRRSTSDTEVRARLAASQHRKPCPHAAASGCERAAAWRLALTR